MSPGAVLAILGFLGITGGIGWGGVAALRSGKPRKPKRPPPWMESSFVDSELQQRWNRQEAERRARADAEAAEAAAHALARAEQRARDVEKAKEIIVDRIAFLRAAKSKAVTRWGEPNPAAWTAAMDDFVKSVLRPRLGFTTLLTWVEASALIEGALAAGGTSASVETMTPLDFEQHCADLLRQAGWQVQTTKASGDQGADVVAIKGGRRAVLQCKLYSRPVGNGAVQEAAAARDYYKADVAAVVTNAGFTAAARDLAQATRVRLMAPEQLPAL